MNRVLIIEDNEDLAFGLRTALEFEGYAVNVAGDGKVGLEAVVADPPDLVVLDLMLPGLDGYAVLRELRQRGVHVPVLILTARGEEADVVLGFDCGADDYVTKPFSTAELLARARALLRRSGMNATGQPETERFGEIEVDPAARTVNAEGRQVDLSPKEFDLLLVLLRRRGATATRAELLKEVWRYENTDVMTRTVDIHVAELRRKLEADPSNPRHILTVRKVGYRLKP
ncbi:MAG TPA: response regulator transcription factor [Longimicrobiales bacterium]|nr:response regulator transcription factor [Longimicrobiales bacterium]